MFEAGLPRCARNDGLIYATMPCERSAANSPYWLTEFIANLQKSPLPQAKALAYYLTNDQIDEHYFKTQATRYIQDISKNAKFRVPELYQSLLEKRQAIKDSEISKNPRGQILEPGFRVIFPEVNKKQGEPQ